MAKDLKVGRLYWFFPRWDRVPRKVKVLLILSHDVVVHDPWDNEIHEYCKGDLSDTFEEAKEKLFRPFYTTRDGGCGLGLSVAAKFVELHGGTMGVESTPGEGAEFWFTLPVV